MIKRGTADPIRKRLILLLGLWVLAIIVSSLLSPHFLQSSTLPYLLQYVPILGLLGMAQTIVMLAGGPGIDLSVGSMLSLTGLAIAALFSLGIDIYLACLLGLVFGGILGAADVPIIEKVV